MVSLSQRPGQTIARSPRNGFVESAQLPKDMEDTDTDLDRLRRIVSDPDAQLDQLRA